MPRKKSPPVPLSLERSVIPAAAAALLGLACAPPSADASTVTVPPLHGLTSITALGFITPDLQAPPDSLPLSNSLLEQTNIRGGGTEVTGSSAVTVSGGFDPSVSASATVSLPCATGPLDTGCGWDASATAGLTYWFAIEGPATTSLIPVLLQGSGSESAGFVQYTTTYGTTVASEAYGTASLYVYTYSGALVTSAGVGAFSDTLQLTPGTLYYADLLANAYVHNSCTFTPLSNTAAQACNGGGGPLIESASVDPTFTIDPNFANDYSIEFSPGILSGAPSSVPEPDSSLFLLGGVVALALIRRRRGR